MIRSALFTCISSMLLCSCNLNFPADSNSALSGRITKKQVMQYLPGVHFGHSKTIHTSASDPESYRVKSGLITHERFLVLEKLDPSTIHMNNYTQMQLDSSFSNQSFTAYEVGPSALAIRYEAFKGRTIRVNQSNRIQVTCKIQKLVLLEEGNETYLTGLLEKPTGSNFDFAWATTNKRLNPYPFTKIEDESLSQLALTHFDSLTEYQRLKEQPLNYGHTQVDIFEFRKTEKYIVVQYYEFGPCNSVEGNYVALYHVTPDHWVREAEGSTGILFDDLIDVDGDLYPELLMSNFNQTSVYEITYRGFDEMETITWSFAEWPC